MREEGLRTAEVQPVW